MLNRWIEDALLDELEGQGMGCIVFTALAQGLLTSKYLSGIPADSRAAKSQSTLPAEHLDESVMRHVRALNQIALERDQTLAQMALQWVLRDKRVTSAVIGASSVEQLDLNIDSLSGPPLTRDQLAAIDQDAVDADINLWSKQTTD
jgi:L-glyceraldehyde 3-phosphate reductase